MCVFLFLLVFCILPNPRSDSMHFYAAKIRLISFMAQKKVHFFQFFSFSCFSAKALSKSMRKLRVLSKVSRRMMRSS